MITGINKRRIKKSFGEGLENLFGGGNLGKSDAWGRELREVGGLGGGSSGIGDRISKPR